MCYTWKLKQRAENSDFFSEVAMRSVFEVERVFALSHISVFYNENTDWYNLGRFVHVCYIASVMSDSLQSSGL